jgi:hypothetical protein
VRRVARRIHIEERNPQAVIERPAQRQLALFAGDKVGDDGPVARDLHIDGHIPLSLDVNDFDSMFRLRPSFGSLIRALLVEILDVDVSDRRTDIGESPRDSLVVADDDIRHARESDAGDVERSRPQMRFVPQIRHLVAEMHIVRQQRLAGHGVRARYDPVVRSVYRRSFGQCSLWQSGGEIRYDRRGIFCD